MEDDDLSPPDSPVEESGVEGSGVNSPDDVEQAQLDRQRAKLQTYLDSVPYKCESIEEMNNKLAHIIGKIYVCAKAEAWQNLASVDHNLHCWLLMRYPIPKATRAKLVRMYYELCLIPGVEPRFIRKWVDMVSLLLGSSNGPRRRLQLNDLELPWKPLWRVLQKELWPMKRLQDSSRNVLNILLFLAEQCKPYFPATDAPEMLSTFLPLLTRDTVLTIVPVMTSFLPPTAVDDYLPVLFSIWEAFNSNIIDERLIDFMGELAEEHVAGTAGGVGKEKWRDVGIFTEMQWCLLMGKCLSSMNVPVGATKGSSTTAGHADALGGKQSRRIKKNTDRNSALAKLIVYSLSVNGPIKSSSTAGADTPIGQGQQQAATSGYLAGSKALDSLEKLITSTETFFHPSNTGPWTLLLSSFLQRLVVEFCKRWKEEEELSCKTPKAQRLTVGIRRAFVLTLRTPTLLALFAKDPMSMGLAQGALRGMALLDAPLIMPQLLERAYEGLEAINETHRTTAVLSMLSGVALPLVSERIWVAGPKHLLPLLELCIPGIDLNDPVKTVCATMFICAALQHIKIGDLSVHAQSVGLLSDDAPLESMVMDVDTELPSGVEVSIDGAPTLSQIEERALVRDSTAVFADWVASLFRRVFALYENLPEEGGRKNTTGGKSEEGVLKAIKSTLDVVCLHLSDPLFDLVLKLVYDYATTNTKSNAVRAFGHLVSCLARVKPQETLDKFLPFCVRQIEEELKYGASSVRTTSTHEAVPSDTTLHWNLSILRGCLGYGGPALLKHQETIINLLKLLIEKTKSERGFSSTGRLITRILHTLSGVYPLNSRFVNTDEWDTPEFNKNHNLHWGRMYDPNDVKIEWHVPSDDEINFILTILDSVMKPVLDQAAALLQTPSPWDNDVRNDFCRYLHAVRSAWSGLPTIIKEPIKEVANPLGREEDLEECLPEHLEVAAGFTLTDPRDSRFHAVWTHRQHFGKVVHQAAITLSGSVDGEDQIDAAMGVMKAIDVYLLEYAMSNSAYSALRKNYTLARDLNRMWSRQKENSRLVFLKRAQVYHSSRVHMHSIYRRRSALDDQLIEDLVDFSLSPYTKLRRHGQAVLHTLSSYYNRTYRLVVPRILAALAKRTEADRMKGALYTLHNKGLAAYVVIDYAVRGDFITALLECQHQEKPSIQKLVAQVFGDALPNFSEELFSNASPLPDSGLHAVLEALKRNFPTELTSDGVVDSIKQKAVLRTHRSAAAYSDLIPAVIEIATRPTTHWRYCQMAAAMLASLMKRDVAPTVPLAAFFVKHINSPHPAMHTLSSKGLVKLLAFVKIRSYSRSPSELWLQEWRNPYETSVAIVNPDEFQMSLQQPVDSTDGRVYVDKIRTGFITWSSRVKAYRPLTDADHILWDEHSAGALRTVAELFHDASYFKDIAAHWATETEARQGAPTDLDLRADNVTLIKSLAKTFEDQHLDGILSVAEEYLTDMDRFRQRAAAEFIAGLLRGSKHWRPTAKNKLWSWLMQRIDETFAQIRPDTVNFWETTFQDQFTELDPRRSQPLVDWLMKVPLEFHSDSVFTMNKSLTLFSSLVDVLEMRFGQLSDRYINLFFDNVHTGYAEIRNGIAQDLNCLVMNEWHPRYPSVDAFLSACQNNDDPLGTRNPKYVQRLQEFALALPAWKNERLPHPRVNQSQYDRVGMTLLTWIWNIGHSPHACLIFPYTIPLLPEILGMTELSDNPELQMYSTAVLYLLSAVKPNPEYINTVADNLISYIRSTTSWKIKLNVLPILIVFFYRNLTVFSEVSLERLTDTAIACLGDTNVEVREMAAKTLSGLLRVSQRRRILPLRDRFVAQVRRVKLPSRQTPGYADALRELHSGILGLCSLVESFPYSVEPWMPPLAEVLAPHASDPPPISTTIRKCASEFKKTHQDTWHTDQLAFNEDQLQSLSNMLIGTSYYA